MYNITSIIVAWTTRSDGHGIVIKNVRHRPLLPTEIIIITVFSNVYTRHYTLCNGILNAVINFNSGEIQK